MSRKKRLHIAIAQLNPCVGDIAGNLRRAKQALAQAAAAKADIILFSELFLSGYAPEDLVLRPAFVQACEAAAQELAAAAKSGPAVIIGLPVARRGRLYNAVMLLDNGAVIAERHKVDLPNYDEFDEKRVFTAGRGSLATTEPVLWRDMALGLPICEDLWNDSAFGRKLAAKGAEWLLAANASPYSRGKAARRLSVAAKQVKKSGLPLIYANQFGGQDEVLFDGGSFALEGNGRQVAQARHFAEDLAVTDWQKDAAAGWQCVQAEKQPVLQGEEADYTACMLALRDYAGKNGFKKLLLGLSGGVDSALCAALAADALGAENVQAVMLPYHYTGSDSLKDAEQCAANLGCRYAVLPIEKAVEAAGGVLAPFLEAGAGLAAVQKAAAHAGGNVWLENLQSRMRGLFLMALSNKSGAMLVTTGNKSEMAVGFATLYGDMNGGFNPIKDVYKMQIYALSRWRNAHRPQNGKNPVGAPIPPHILTRAPSAELGAGQRDEDRLPPYPLLDAVLQCFIEKEMDCPAIIKAGYPQDVVERVEHLLYIAEYKRRQAAPGVKLGARAFGKTRRYPIGNGFRTAAGKRII